jgi:hypothetical protein
VSIFAPKEAQKADFFDFSHLKCREP